MKHRNRPSSLIALLIATCPVALACGSSSGGAPSGGVDASAGDSGAGSTTNNPDSGGSGTSPSDAGGDGASLPVAPIYIDGVTVSTLAGSDVSGTQDGTGAAAQFDNPTGITLDTAGDLLVTDYDDGRVRRVTAAGVVTTIAATTNFTDPFTLVVATDGKYYVETDSNSSGVKSDTSGTIWLVTPVAGGIATPTVVAQNFDRPRSLAPMPGGNLFVADRDQDVAETVTMSSGQATIIAGTAGMAGDVDGTGASARFNVPSGAAAMADGSFLLTDPGNNVVRRVTPTGVVTTFAGNGLPTLVDGPCSSASFNGARGVAVDSAGNAYVSDVGNHVIRRISSGTCTVKTVAGNMALGFADGAGNTAQFYGQEGIAVTSDGTTVYVTDGNGGDGSAHHRVRAIAMPANL